MGIRILLVEDDELIGTSLTTGPREEGYSVERAADGKSAWDYLRRGGWELVILDWWLPTQDGLTLLRRYRELDRRTPVLFLTARDDVSERVRGLDAGATTTFAGRSCSTNCLPACGRCCAAAKNDPGPCSSGAG